MLLKTFMPTGGGCIQNIAKGVKPVRLKLVISVSPNILPGMDMIGPR